MIFGKLIFFQILHKRAIEASDAARPIPDLRTGDIIEIKLVSQADQFVFSSTFLRFNLFVNVGKNGRKFRRTGEGFPFTRAL